MSDKLFDEFIRQKLTDHSSAVPNDMWDRIQAGSRKRRVAAWWRNPLALLVVGMLLLGGGYFVYQNMDNESADALATGNTSTPEVTTSNPSEKNNGRDINPGSDVQIGDQNAIGGEDVNTTETNQNSNQSNAVARNSKAIKIDGAITSKEERIQASAKDKLFSSRKSGTRISTSNSKAVSNSQMDIVSKALQGGHHSIIDNNNSDDYRLQDFNLAFRNVLSEVAGTKKELAKSKSMQELLKNWKFNGFTECPSAYGEARNDWYIEGFVSPDYAFKTTKNASLPASYFALKDSTEHFQTAFTAGIRLSKNIGENLMLKSGLQYSQINEKFSYRSENERRLITVVTIRTIIRSPGDTITVTDTSMVEQIGYRVRTTQNHYRSLDIPVILGYEWGNDKWKWGVNAGAIFNIRSWQHGEMLDTSYTPVSFDKSSTQTFKQNIGLGLYGSFSIIKPITDRMDIFAEPYFRYSLSDMTKSKSLVDQRFHSAGINFGVRYKLNATRQR